jgi:hypothetical protein
VLLGVPVVPGEREGGLRRGSDEGEVYDALDARLDRRVHGRGVPLRSVGRLAGRYHEKGARAGQSPPQRLGIFV